MSPERRAERQHEHEHGQEPESFADWIRFYFGEGIARHFMVPYNAKLWGVSVDQITSRWCQRFVPKPRLEEIVAGAAGKNQDAMGYNARFIYPKKGGIGTLAAALARAVDLRTSTRVTAIDLAARLATVEGGGVIGFDHLVSTMPLPALVGILADVPPEVRTASGRLRATDTPYFNVAVSGELGVDDHWIYVPEERWPMYRVGSFSNAVPEMAPPGCHSLYVEIADRETPLDAQADAVKEGLVAMGLIRDPEQILFMAPRRIHGAYVVYDFDYHAAREEIQGWLGGLGVQSIGRYGDWKYCSMEDALVDGRRAALKL